MFFVGGDGSKMMMRLPQPRRLLLLLSLLHVLLWMSPVYGQYLVVNPVDQSSSSVPTPAVDIFTKNNDKNPHKTDENISKLKTQAKRDITSSMSINREITWPEEVKLGVILPKGLSHLPYYFENIYPAILIAISNVMARADLLPGVNLTTTPADSQCSVEYGPLAAIDMYLQKTADVFFGPACDYPLAQVSRFQKEWKMPILSTCLYSAFAEKQDYPTLTGVIGLYGKLASFFSKVLKRFDWDTVGFIFHLSDAVTGPLQSDPCLQVVRPVFDMVKAMGNHAPYSAFKQPEVDDWGPHVTNVAKDARMMESSE